MPTKEQARQELTQIIELYRRTKNREALSESDVIQKFIEPLFEKVLGWDIGNPEIYTNEVHLQSGGRVDRLLKLSSGEPIYIEAKRFGVIKTLTQMQAERNVGGIIREAQRRESDLERALGPDEINNSAMAPNRSREEQQAINYAFENNGTWAILTNFERFRLYNARRDWLVFSIEDIGGYLDKFDILWLLSYENLQKNSLDTLKNLRYASDIDREYLNLINIWRQRLASSLVNYKEANPWMLDTEGNLIVSRLRDVVQRLIDRLVIIRFAEDHLVIPPGSLYKIYELEKENIYTFTIDEFVQRFFREFDKTHNSALFSEGVVDKARFHPDDTALKDLIGQLYLVKYRAMPADILGNTYEQYLGKTLVVDDNKVITRDNLETRKKQGSYYTPGVIVCYMVDNSLGRYLYGTDNGKPDGNLLEGETRKYSRDIMDLRVLDSACGSGSFLIYAYQVLRDFYESEIVRLDDAYKQGIASLAAKFGDTTLEEEVAVKQYEIERERIRTYPGIILEQHIYGVDLDPQAAEIAVVNLMMRAMEKQGSEKRLPLILNQNVKVGNALIGMRPDDPRLSEHQASLAKIRQHRADLKATANTDPGHDKILENLNSELDTVRTALNSHYAGHFSDLEQVHLFHWAVEFPEAFVDENGAILENSGFQVIIGNPPWEIIQPDLREFYAQFDENIESRLNRKQVEARIEELVAEDPGRLVQYDKQVEIIKEQAAYFKATDDYPNQGRGKSATHKLFVERVYSFLSPKGRLGYVVPSGIYAEYGSTQLREMFLNRGSIEYIFSFSNERFFFPGVDHRFKFALIGLQKDIQSNGFWATFRFNPRVAISPDEFQDFVANYDNLIYVNQETIKKFSPETLSLMEFESKVDYHVAEKIYQNVPLVAEKIDSKWYVNLHQEFNITSHRRMFNEDNDGIPLYEGKMVHQFDAFFAKPRYWINTDNFAKLSGELQEQIKTYRVVHRRIASSTNERTLISTIVPPNTACEINATVALVENCSNNNVKLYLCSMLNSLCLDYIIRYKVVNTLNMFYMYTLPLPRLTEGNPYFDALVIRAAQLTCVREEFADLWSEVMGTEWTLPIPPESREGEEKAVQVSPESLLPVTDDSSRQKLRNEIDALVAHLYGLSQDEFAHILGTFPLVFPDTGEGQAKKETLLAEYDTWQDSVKDWSRQ